MSVPVVETPDAAVTPLPFVPPDVRPGTVVGLASTANGDPVLVSAGDLTVMTEAVMKVAPVDRPVASAAYSFVRFTGGAVAPWMAGRLAEDVGPSIPFYVGAGAVVVAIGVLALGRELLYAADKRRVAASEAALLAPAVAASAAS